MTWLAHLVGVQPERIGPGRLVLVVGPSGAGKDTLIRAVQEACRGDRNVVFPRRVVTRQGTPDEDHDTLDRAAFDRAVAEGAFALRWSAHGLSYGVPISIDADIRAGRTVVCNVSRTILEEARTRYENAVVTLITVPPDVALARLVARGRSSDGDLLARHHRSTSSGYDCPADVVIQNTTSIEHAARKLMDVIRPQWPCVSL